MADWKAIAQASGVQIPAEDILRIVPVLESLEAEFTPLRDRLPIGEEPVLILSELALV